MPRDTSVLIASIIVHRIRKEEEKKNFVFRGLKRVDFNISSDIQLSSGLCL